MQRAAGLINGVAFVAFAKIQHDQRAVAFNTRLAVRLMAFVTIPVLWGIGAVAPELVEIAIGPAWAGSILPLTLVALTIPFRMIGSIVSTTVMSMGRVDVAMVTTVIGACISPILFFLGSRYGILGLSEAWLVVTPILFALNMYRTLPILGLTKRAIFAEIWRPAVIGVVMFLMVEALRQLLLGLPVALLFGLLVIAGALTYMVGTWLLNRPAAAEALSLLFPGRFARLQMDVATRSASTPATAP
jgi:O-antigen/teichoic acid export membrane protein